MSVNKSVIAVSGVHVDSSSNQREFVVYEADNSKNKENNRITLYANTYTWFEFYQKYKSSKFYFCDVVITNRFTMDRTKFTIDFRKDMYDDETVHNIAALSEYTHTNYDSNIDVKYSQIMAYDNTSNKQNAVYITLSMYDFMYGDICVQFYDDPLNKDQYCKPVIVQFTHAPTVCFSNIYKWNPNAETHIADEDVIFTSSFGSVSAHVPDTGRTNVLSGSPAEATNYYNDFMSANRLITNGLAETETASFSGHPVYTIEYTAFVPSAFAEQFGYVTSSVAFSAINNEHGYLTSAVDNWQTMQTEKLDLNMYLQNTDRHYQLTAAKSATNPVATIGGLKQTFVAHLTAAPGDKPDKWFRQHTRACADFVLSGLDPYWTGESSELPPRIRLVYRQREFAGLDDQYVPPVFELAWYATGAPTHYYLLKKGGNRNNNADWIEVFNPQDYKTYVPHYGDIRVVNYIYKEGDPWQSYARPMYGIIILTPENYHIRDNLPEIELDANKRPIIKMYFEGNGGRIWYSDGADAADHFLILDEEEKNGLKVIAVRTSDDYNINFSPQDADAEFMILYTV